MLSRQHMTIPVKLLFLAVLFCSFPRITCAADQEIGDAYADILSDLEEETPAVRVADPLYYWNKGMYHVNDRLYFWLMKPVATGYKKVTPDPVRNGIKNFFSNLMAPVRFVNCILQGKSEKAGVELGRFMVNTTVGLGGFWSPADKEPSLRKVSEEDFGQTLAVYGVGNGFYLVWPVIGPSTLRDTAAMGFDNVIAPGPYLLSPMPYLDTEITSLSMWAVDKVNALSFRLGDYETLKGAAIEPYEAFRDAYIQNREKKIRE